MRRAVLMEGRPPIATESFVRLMVLKQRYRWGYRTLVAEVSDSIQGAGARSLTLDGKAAAGDHPHDPSALGGGEGRGAGAGRADGRAPGALAQGGSQAPHRGP